MRISYRFMEVGDGAQYCTMMNSAGGQSPFLAFGADQFYLDAPSADCLIDRLGKNENEAFFVAESGGSFIGSCMLESSVLPRLRHAAEVRIAVLQAYWGQGVAKTLLGLADTFFQSNAVLTRLGLHVSNRHIRGISLYKKLGFVEEGLQRSGIFVDGEYHDLLVMGKTKNQAQSRRYADACWAK